MSVLAWCYIVGANRRRPSCVLPRMVFVHHQSNGGRKLIRPIIEEAVATWTGE